MKTLTDTESLSPEPLSSPIPMVIVERKENLDLRKRSAYEGGYMRNAFKFRHINLIDGYDNYTNRTSSFCLPAEAAQLKPMSLMKAHDLARYNVLDCPDRLVDVNTDIPRFRLRRENCFENITFNCSWKDLPSLTTQHILNKLYIL